MLANMMLDTQQQHSHHNRQPNARRNSFSSFVRTLFLLVSPSSTHDDDGAADQKPQDCAESKHSNSIFMEMYFSFPALEDPESETSSINCAAEQRNGASFLVESSNRILC
ncbi:hypothetical protein BX666DRAFT_1966568 [Dichotomocladium elegans]|nr:hypothetical protein BX666DRAFT_1966568 [Dichotomocladium elegans]